jgi:hypothetical protein
LATRREILRTLSLTGMGAATLPAWGRQLVAVAEAHAPVATSASDSWKPSVLTAHEDQMVIALSEAILPATDTPGARDALVNRFVDAILDDANKADREKFVGGLRWIDDRCLELFGCDYLASLPEQQNALLTILGSPGNTSPSDTVGVELFETLKTLTVTGYYTSEVGIRDELKDDGNMFFTGFEGCTHPAHGGGKARG